VCVRDRGDYQHDQIDAANGFGDVGRQAIDWDQPLLNAACLDATLRVQSGEALRVAGMETHRVTAFAEVSSGRATAMSRAKNRNRVHSHFAFRVRNVMERKIMGSVAQLSIEPASSPAATARSTSALVLRPQKRGQFGEVW
jgi:ABC-type protease/lipase transport system fused ATPase/permease subunit